EPALPVTRTCLIKATAVGAGAAGVPNQSTMAKVRIRSAIVFAAAAAVGAVFALTPPADARFVGRCSAKYDVAAKAGCGATSANPRRPPPQEIVLGGGEVVSITIFESPGGVFVPNDAGARPGNFVTLPNQIVDSNGNITAPYAGTIRAAGRTPSEVQQAVNEALRALPRYRSGK